MSAGAPATSKCTTCATSAKVNVTIVPAATVSGVGLKKYVVPLALPLALIVEELAPPVDCAGEVGELDPLLDCAGEVGELDPLHPAPATPTAMMDKSEKNLNVVAHRMRPTP